MCLLYGLGALAGPLAGGYIVEVVNNPPPCKARCELAVRTRTDQSRLLQPFHRVQTFRTDCNQIRVPPLNGDIDTVNEVEVDEFVWRWLIIAPFRSSIRWKLQLRYWVTTLSGLQPVG